LLVLLSYTTTAPTPQQTHDTFYATWYLALGKGKGRESKEGRAGRGQAKGKKGDLLSFSFLRIIFVIFSSLDTLPYAGVHGILASDGVCEVQYIDCLGLECCALHGYIVSVWVKIRRVAPETKHTRIARLSVNSSCQHLERLGHC
jgi:hypothetical protein